MRALLVLSHNLRPPGRVCGQDRGKPAPDALLLFFGQSAIPGASRELDTFMLAIGATPTAPGPSTSVSSLKRSNHPPAKNCAKSHHITGLATGARDRALRHSAMA